MAINHSYSPGCGVCLGVFHILFGLGTCACGIAAIIMNMYLYYIGLGIWAGVAFYSVTGAMAFASSGRNNSAIAGYYVMALLSVFVAMGQMGLYTWTIIWEVWDCGDSLYYDVYNGCTTDHIQALIVHGVLLILGFLEWIIAMVSCCTACSCCFNSDVPPTQTVVIHTTQPGPVMMPPPQAGYAGQPGGSVPAPMPIAPTPGYSEKPQLINNAPSGPPVYMNPAFDQSVPTADAQVVLPNTPDPNKHTSEY